MTSAPLWILAVALVSRDGCGDPPKPATGSAVVAAGSSSSAGSATPSLAPVAAPAVGSAAPTTTTMSRDAQAKLDKLVGAKPGTHKPIKPTPEPKPAATPGSDAGSGSGSAAKPAKKKNQFPYDGREMSENEMFSYPDMDHSKESWDYGATVRLGYSSVPHYIAYRCITKPTCRGWTAMGEDWKAVGWWGAVM